MLKRVDTPRSTSSSSRSPTASRRPSYQTYDLAADGVGYSTSGGFIDDIIGQIDDYAEQIKSGEIKVPTAP